MTPHTCHFVITTYPGTFPKMDFEFGEGGLSPVWNGMEWLIILRDNMIIFISIYILYIYLYIYIIILINTYSISAKCSMLLQSNIQFNIDQMQYFQYYSFMQPHFHVHNHRLKNKHNSFSDFCWWHASFYYLHVTCPNGL